MVVKIAHLLLHDTYIFSDVFYIREDIGIMQKQVRDLNKHTNMGLGGIKVLLIVGAVVGAIWTLMKIMGGR